jgi:hypothetical protein
MKKKDLERSISEALGQRGYSRIKVEADFLGKTAEIIARDANGEPAAFSGEIRCRRGATKLCLRTKDGAGWYEEIDLLDVMEEK